MKRRKSIAIRTLLRRMIGGGVLSPIHRAAVCALNPRPGDRMWLTTEFGGAQFTRYPIGPRPADGRRLSIRLRKLRGRRRDDGAR
jgi:hypothetical protein